MKKIKKRRTNIMPEHLKRQRFVVKELHNSFGKYIERVVQSNLDPFEWRVFVITPLNGSVYAINTKDAHELCEAGHPCHAYIDSTFVQVYEDYFIG